MADGRDVLPVPKKKESVVAWIGAMIVLTVVAAGTGGFVSMRLTAPPKPAAEAAAVEAAPATPKFAEGTALVELPPVVTTLTEPADTWIRLQASIVFDTKAVPKPEVLAAEIADDTLGFLKTLSAGQIGGASGLLHLREDLSERARIRSDGRIREFMIETMVVQ